MELRAHLLRVTPARTRAALACSVAAIALLAVIDWKTTSVQLGTLALVPLALFTWFAGRRLPYALALAMAVVFTYFDYAGPQAGLVNLPLDTVFTVVSYLAAVALVLAARGSIDNVLRLREQLAISSEAASIQRWLADHDALTSAANRRAFRKAMMETAAAAGLQAGGFGIVVGDVDNFKTFNTRHGRRVGDRLLCMLFSRAQSCCGPDAVVGRLDGDEFSVIFASAASDWELSQAAKRLAKELREPYVVDDRSFELRVTLATALFPNDAADADVLLEIAEAKLYEAKRARRN